MINAVLDGCFVTGFVLTLLGVTYLLTHRLERGQCRRCQVMIWPWGTHCRPHRTVETTRSRP